ncbi:MAG: hypothetical protein GY749_34965, partial [Desulfobacteraceae bacterium]|nr:hypothetical protein [Desulfobacteraceae bacterium]
MEDTVEVRDAAFSALEIIHAEKPFLSARAGLEAAHEDVKQRGLQIVVREIRKKKKKIPDQALDLMLQALNDDMRGIRSEAFKAVINQEIGGSAKEALKFVMKSTHHDIRYEVLTEIMARWPVEWAGELLKTLMNDQHQGLRKGAFDYALEKAKHSDYSSLDAARESVFADIREAALKHLITKKTPEAQERIAKALEDEVRTIRLKALDALTAIVDKDTLSKALKSSHRDVRAGAATALARQGDPDALDPLTELIKTPPPEDEKRRQLLNSLEKALEGVGDIGEHPSVDAVPQIDIKFEVEMEADAPSEHDVKKQWIASVEKALEGIAELGDPKALDPVVLLVKSEHAPVRKAAVNALAWICRPGKDSPLQQAVRHSDPDVSTLAAFGLAICGNSTVRSSVFSKQGEKILGEIRQLAAALALDNEPDKKDKDSSDFTAYENHLLALLEHKSKNLQQTALFSLMLRELATWEDQPRRCIACLSAQSPDTRITAGAGISAFGDKQEFLNFILDIVNDKGEKPAWKISAESVRDMADLVTFGDSQVRARCAWMIWHLTDEKENAWHQAWEIFSRRFTENMEESRKVSDKLEKPKTDRSYLDQLSFGAYVGLVREQGGYHKRGQRPESGPHVIRVRQKALRLILDMAKKNETFAVPAQAVFVQAMGDPNQPVRLQAFEHLQVLGMAPDVLGTEALLSSFTDLGVMGLKLLTSSKSPKAADDIIRDVMMSRTDGLETEAAKMRMAHLSVVQVASQALEAGSHNLRRQGVNWLSEEYGKDDKARAELVKAVDSRFRQVRVFAAYSLAGHKDQKAFNTLCDLLRETRTVSDPNLNQKRIIASLIKLGDSRAADHFLDRIEDDPEKNAEKDNLLRGAGQFRNPGIADRLLKMMENKERRTGAYGALLTVSGYDQPIEDPEDENPDKKWIEKQHPRNDAVLANLLSKCLELNAPNLIRSLVFFARWPPSNEIDPIFSELASYPDDRIRHSVLESIGWRARKRSGPVDALVRTLEHRDPDSKFLAAEALAKAGHDNGITILLTAVDLMSDIRFRMRAVMALGELADERALDMLLKLASEQDHALQETALEAIGHMGKSDKADQIFDLLEKHAQEYGGIGQMAIKGLRWLNTPRAWNLIREKAADPDYDNCETAIALLCSDDDPVTRELLLKIIRDEDDYYSRHAFQAAQKLWEPGALELDYALMQSGWAHMEEDAVKRVCENGDPEKIFELFPYCMSGIQSILEAGLLKQSPLPVKPAKKAIQSPFPETVRTAARILGYVHGIDAGPVETALAAWSEKWKIRYDKLKGKAIQDDQELKQIAECLTQLSWASGQLSKNPNILLSLVHEHTEYSLYKPVILQTMAALGHFEPDPDVIKFLESVLSDPDKGIRRAATESLFRVNAKIKPVEDILSDRNLFDRTAAYADVQELVSKGCADVHSQGVVMPHLVRAGDSDSIFKVAIDTNLSDTVRMGAIETLARMADDGAEKQLVKIGKSEQADEELRKAAWRGLRRSKRARKKL